MTAVVQIGGLKRSSPLPSALSPLPSSSSSPQPPAPSPQSRAPTQYTCPMDPEVVSDKPGACPKCGMALEPMITDLSADADAPNPELVDMTRRFWIGVVLGAPVFLVTMGDMVSGGALMHRLGAGVVNWIGLALAIPVVLWCGRPFFERMWASFVNASPNMFTLIGIGTGAAFVYSAAATVAPGAFPARPAGARRRRDVLRHGRGHHRARAPRPGSGAARASPHRRRDPAAAGAGAEDGADGARRSRGRRPARVGPARRYAARAPRREGPRRRRRCRRRGRGGRVDGHRRVDPGGQGARRSCHRGDDLRERDAHAPGRTRRQRDAARADRPDGRRGAAHARADSAARGPDRRVLRSGGDPRGRRVVCRLGPVGPCAPARACPRQQRGGPDHRVPVCARPGHADGHHGREPDAARTPVCSSRTPKHSSSSRAWTCSSWTRPAR